MSGPRDPYPEVGAAIRQAVDRAIAQKLPGRDLRVLLAVISLVSSYSRIDEDGHTVAILAATAGLDRRHAQRSLRRLESAGVISFEAGCGSGHRSRVGLPRSEERAAADGALSTTETAAADGALSSEKGRPFRAKKGGRFERKRAAVDGAPTELTRNRARPPARARGGAGSFEKAAPPLLREACNRCGSSPSRDRGEDGVLCDECHTNGAAATVQAWTVNSPERGEQEPSSVELLRGVREHGNRWQVRVHPFAHETLATPAEANARSLELRALRAAGVRDLGAITPEQVDALDASLKCSPGRTVLATTTTKEEA